MQECLETVLDEVEGICADICDGVVLEEFEGAS
jgi:hypothetical protein